MNRFERIVNSFKRRYAFTATWIASHTATVDPSKPWLEGSRTGAAHTVSLITEKCVLTAVEETNTSNSRINVDFELILFPGTYEPSLADLISWDNEVYKVSKLVQFAPSDIVLYYIIGLSR